MYKDPEKQKQAVREAVRRYRERNTRNTETVIPTIKTFPIACISNLPPVTPELMIEAAARTIERRGLPEVTKGITKLGYGLPFGKDKQAQGKM